MTRLCASCSVQLRNMFNFRNSLLGDILPSPAFARLAVLVFVVLALASFRLVAVAQEGDGGGGVEGTVIHEHEDATSLWTCPAAAPTRLLLTVFSLDEGIEITVTFGTASFAGPSGQLAIPKPIPGVSHEVVKLLRSSTSTTESGAYSSDSSVDDESTPVAFSDLSAGWYKVRGRRCIDADRNECGGWSGYSNAVQVAQSAPPPTGLSLRLIGDNNLELTYSRSPWPGHTTKFYEFELHRSDTASGTYAKHSEGDHSVLTPKLRFNNVHTGYHYKVKGRQCSSADTNCGSWTALTNTSLNVPAKTYAKPNILSLTVPDDGNRIEVGFRKSSVSSLSSHYYAFELHRADSASGAYSLNAAEVVSKSKAKFEGIDRSKVYRVRAKRCKEEDGKVCGPWTDFTDPWDGPNPPSAVPISLTSPNTLKSTYTRSESATGYYQFQLRQSAKNSGPYSDYGSLIKITASGVSTTSTVSLSSVHTGFYYKAVGRRCKTSATDCGEWSSESAWLNVPLSRYPAPAISSTALENYDEVKIEFSMPTGDDAPTDVYPMVQLHRSSSATGDYAVYAVDEQDNASPVKFTDVAITSFYKVRARTCSDETRKDCGIWSALTASPLEVPSPTFPTLSAPSIALGVTGSVDVAFSLPSNKFGYLLTLQWSENNITYDVRRSYAYLAYGGTLSHNFSGLKPQTGGHYKAELFACTDNARKNCGMAKASEAISLPLIAIASTTPVDIAESVRVDISIVASSFNTTSRYKIIVSTTNDGTNADVLRLARCSISARTTSTDRNAGRGASGQAVNGSVSVPIHGCDAGQDQVTAKLVLDGVEHAIDTHTFNVIGIPRNVRANGHSTSQASPRARIKWDDATTGITRYEYRFGLHETPPDTFRNADAIDWSGPVSSQSRREASIFDVELKQLYAIQVRSVKGSTITPWSELAFVYPTHEQPSIVSGAEPTVATIPLYGYWESTHYEYGICTNLAPSGAEFQKWSDQINRGFSRWEDSVAWTRGSANIIRVSGTTKSDCTKSVAFTDVDGQNEVKRLSMTLTHRLCNENEAIACAITYQVARDESFVIFRDEDDKDQFTWGANLSAPEPGSGCSKLFKTSVHESGHIFGLHHIESSTSPVRSSVTDDHCGPTGYDVMAIFSIYQSYFPE